MLHLANVLQYKKSSPASSWGFFIGDLSRSTPTLFFHTSLPPRISITSKQIVAAEYCASLSSYLSTHLLSLGVVSSGPSQVTFRRVCASCRTRDLQTSDFYTAPARASTVYASFLVS
jgi:hypothetical protein